MKYTELTFTELVNKIGSSRFFDLPKMVKESFLKLSTRIGNLETSTEPKYKVYTALLTQTGTTAPVATVLENTIGDVVLEREDVGQYKAILEGAFTEGKTSATLQSTRARGATYSIKEITDYILIEVTDATDTGSDDLLENSLFEIRVYN